MSNRGADRTPDRSCEVWLERYYCESINAAKHIDGLLMAVFSFSIVMLTSPLIIYSANDLSKGVKLATHAVLVTFGVLSVLLIRRLTQNHNALLLLCAKIEVESNFQTFGPVSHLIQSIRSAKSKIITTYNIYPAMVVIITAMHFLMLIFTF